MNPLPPAACAAAKHAAARATIGISTQFLLIQPCPSAKRTIRMVSQVNASPTNAPIPISSTTTQTTCPTVPPSTWVVVEEIGIGALVGLALTWLTIRMVRFAEGQGWISKNWVEIPIVALAAACFAAAQAAGGSGFIACYVGGLLLSGLGAHHKEELLRGAEHMGEALALLTWVVFGGIVVARMIDRVTWPALLYAVLSLTVIRMLPVFLCLIGTRTTARDKLFIGWFGPRGLA